MRFWRPPATPLAWLAATAASVAVAWVALRPVLDTAVPDRTAPLSATEIQHLALPSVPPAPGPSGPAGTPVPSGSPSPGGPASPSASGRPVASGGTPAGSVPSASGVDGWTVTVQADGTPSYLRSFQVPGGSAMIRMVPGRVFLVSATPNPDYSVQPSQSDPTRLVVEFIATGRYDVVDAMWWNDRPYAQVSHVG